MRIGNSSLIIPEGREWESGHVGLPHGRQFTVNMRNHWHDRACDAELTVDGKDCGGWRICAGGSVTLERPANDTGRFTFYKSDSTEAAKSGVSEVASEQRGLVVVRFRPEHKRTRSSVLHMTQNVNVKGCGGGMSSLRGMPVETANLSHTTTDCCDEEKTSGGITGLSGHSDQRFSTVSPLNYDPNEEVVITVRLVCVEDVRPLQSVTPRSNPVPAAVE